jgi:hypothetical protein
LIDGQWLTPIHSECKPVPAQKQGGTIYQLKVELAEIEPLIWRRFLVPSTVTLHRLHLVLQDVMGWSNYHLYRFKIGKLQYGEPNPDNEFYELHFLNSKRAKIGRTIAAVGDTVSYEYDFGDGWTHRLLLEDILKPKAGARYPICLEGERACPPEDSGGPHGYVRFLSIVANPDHEQYEEMKLWLGRRFRPDDFSLAKVNRRLRNF